MKKYKVNANDILFTSDLHFLHGNILKFCNRPYDNIEEMTEGIIKNWNEQVSNNQTVFVLGDVTWGNVQVTNDILNQLNGKIVLIRGNHDNDRVCKLFDDVHDMLSLEVIDDVTGKTKYVHLCHYPILEWDGFYRNSWHLHGHLHSNNEKRLTGERRLDVGLDGNNIRLYTWNDIKQILNK